MENADHGWRVRSGEKPAVPVMVHLSAMNVCDLRSYERRCRRLGSEYVRQVMDEKLNNSARLNFRDASDPSRYSMRYPYAS
jgi:hypothetical protein